MAIAILGLASGATAAPEEPDPSRFPGALNASVTQENIGSTICRKGWTKTVRPSPSYTGNLKRHLFQDVRGEVVDGRPVRLRDFELDHLIPLELGGSPDDRRNLWLEPRYGRWPAELKDDLENRLNVLACRGTISLAEAQRAIATDWIGAYHKYMQRNAKGNRAP